VIDSEVFSFMQVFRSVQRVFPLRGEEHEVNDVGASYFKALKRFDLKAVQSGADRWLQQGKRFPKPAEWIDAIPRRLETVEIAALAGLEAKEWLDAEQQRWENSPCLCPECRAANVEEKPLRFVPNDPIEQGKIGERIVTRGHWIHGWDLFRWYQARADFYNRCVELGLRGDVLRLKPEPRRRRSSKPELLTE